MDETTTFLMSGKENGTTLPAINEHLAMAGLSITQEDALMLAKQRAELLAEVERVEFGSPAIATIAEAVAGSPFLLQDNVVDVLTELQEVFYTLRNDLSIDIPDTEVVEALRGCFDTYEGNLMEVSALPKEEVMAFSKEYHLALDAGDEGAYSIVDDEGRVYAFDPDEWDYDEHVTGWDDERWSDDWND